MRTLCIAKSKAKALWSQPVLITEPQAANPIPSGLQQKMWLVVHRVLGAHGYNKNSETMRCRVCTDTIQSNKFVLGSVNVQYSAPTKHQKRSDHQDAVLTKQRWVNVQKAVEKLQISVTALYSQLRMAFVFTCARSLWFKFDALRLICISNVLTQKRGALTHKLPKWN